MALELGLLANQLAIGVTGYALLYAVGLAHFRRTDLRFAGLAYLLGWALLGVVLSLALIAGVGLRLPLVLFVVALVVVAGVALGRRRTRVEPSIADEGHPLALAAAWLGAVVITVVAVSGLAVAAATQWNAATEFDAFWFFIPRAETIYYAHGLDAGLWGALPDPARPPLISVMDAVTFRFAGGVHPSLLVTQRALVGVAFLLAVATMLARLAPRWVVFPTVAALGAAPWFWSRLDSPMADLTVTYLITAGALACLLWLREGNAAWLSVAVVLLSAATLTKSEGQVFAALLAVVVLVAGFVRHRRAALPGLSLLIVVVLFEPWRLWLSHHELPTSMSDFRLGDLFDPGYLSGRGSRLDYAVQEQWRTSAKLLEQALGGWHTGWLGGFLLALPLLVALALAARRAPLLSATAAIWVVVAYFGLAVTYWISRPPLAHYMNMTVRRVEPTIVAAAIVLFALAVGSVLPNPVRARAAIGVPRVALWLGVAAAVAVVVAVADTRPRTSRSGRVDVPTLNRELAAQFHSQLFAATYPYDVKAACTGDASGLSFNCLISTTRPVGSPPKVLTWNETVICRTGPTEDPRCMSSRGDALD